MNIGYKKLNLNSNIAYTSRGGGTPSKHFCLKKRKRYANSSAVQIADQITPKIRGFLRI